MTTSSEATVKNLSVRKNNVFAWMNGTRTKQARDSTFYKFQKFPKPGSIQVEKFCKATKKLQTFHFEDMKLSQELEKFSFEKRQLVSNSLRLVLQSSTLLEK